VTSTHTAEGRRTCRFPDKFPFLPGVIATVAAHAGCAREIVVNLHKSIVVSVVLMLPVHAEAENTTPPVVVTATRTSQSVDESLASVSVITREEIERLQPSDLVELLRAQAGIDMPRAGGQGQQTSLFLRGTNSSHVLVLVDGVRAASSTSGIFAWQNIDPASIERIEIVRGPRATLYGSEALGGVIQIFTRQPQGAEVRLEGGSLNTRAVEAGAGSSGPVKVYAQAFSRYTSGYSATNSRAGFSYNPDDDAARQRGINAGLNTQLGDNILLDVRGWLSTMHLESDPASESESTNYVLNSRLRQQIFPNWVHTLSLGSSTDRINTDDQSPFPYSTRIAARRQSGDWQNDISLTPTQLLTAGINLSQDEGRIYNESAGVVEFDRVTRNAGVFAHWQGRFETQSLQLGYRHDDHNRFGGHDSGHLAWGWDMTPRWRWLASYSTAFKAPDLNQLYHPGYGGFYAGNPNLQPETARTAELGILLKPGFRQRLRGSYYITHVTDLIVYENPATNFQASNIGKAELHGLELEYSVRLGNWQALANATHQVAKNDEANLGLLRRPRNKVATRLDYSFDRRSHVGLEMLAVSAHDDIDNVTFSTIEVSGYTLFNFVATLWLTKQWSITARVENPTDREYETISGYNTSPRAAYVAMRYASGKAP